MLWLTKELRAEIRNRFQPNYPNHLSESEVEEIALNLVKAVETIAQYAKDNKHESEIHN